MADTLLGALSNIFSRKAFIRRRGFEGDRVLLAAFRWFSKECGYKCVVETGTKRGDTTTVLAEIFDVVFSIEKDRNLAPLLERRLAHLKHVSVAYGDSSKVLKEQVLPSLSYPVMFFLDAHDGPEIETLMGELEVMMEVGIPKGSLIVIHDVYVPGKPFGHNDYRLSEMSYQLNQINGDYKTCYNHDAVGLKRGVLFFGPKDVINRFQTEFQSQS